MNIHSATAVGNPSQHLSSSFPQIVFSFVKFSQESIRRAAEPRKETVQQRRCTFPHNLEDGFRTWRKRSSDSSLLTFPTVAS